jgi:hypothetical protein
MTEGYPAVHTPGSLFAPFLIGKPDLHLTVIVDPFLHGPIPGLLAPYL